MSELWSVRALLTAIGEDPDRDGLADTPGRYIGMLDELTKGYGQHVELKTFENDSSYSQMITVGPVQFYSLCEHHMIPFFGDVWVSYIPGHRIVGLSKLARLVEKYARRLQVQERLTSQVGSELDERVEPQGVGVKVRARHLCMEMRGVSKPGAYTTTTYLTGAYEQVATRDEFLRSCEWKS